MNRWTDDPTSLALNQPQTGDGSARLADGAEPSPAPLLNSKDSKAVPMIHPTDREQRTTWRWRAELLVRRGAAFVLDPGNDAKRLTYNHVTIGQRLLDFAVGTGRAFPSHETLAKRTGMSVGTVATALNLLAAAGLLAWVQTWVPNPGGFHGAKRQGPNLYSFLLPGDSGSAAYDPKPCRVGNPSTQSSFLRPAVQAGIPDTTEARAALEAIRNKRAPMIAALLGRRAAPAKH